MKFKMFLVVVLTFILMPCVGYAEDVVFFDKENSLMDDSEWITLYKGICTSRGHKGVLGENASGCIYYWGEVASSTSTPTSPSPKPSMDPTVPSTNSSTNSSTVIYVTTKGFSDDTVTPNESTNGCSGNSGTRIPGAAGQSELVNPATCKSGVPEKVELIGFDVSNIDNLYKLLENSNCASRTCYRYVKKYYCDYWKDSDDICTKLKEKDLKENVEENSSTTLDFDEYETCEEFLSDNNAVKLRDILKSIVQLSRVLIPIIVIVFSTLDFARAVFSGEEQTKKIKTNFFMRIVIAVVIFLLPILLHFLLNIANQIWPNISTNLCGIL